MDPTRTHRFFEALGSAPADCVHQKQFAALLGYSMPQVEHCCHKLMRRGYLDRIGRGCYRLNEKGRQALISGERIRGGSRATDRRKPRPRNPNSFYQRVWTALRYLRTATAPDIVMLVGAPDYRTPRTMIRKLMCWLKAAGVVVELDRREPSTKSGGRGFKRFRLVRDLGPFVPIWRARDQRLFDPNSGELL